MSPAVTSRRGPRVGSARRERAPVWPRTGAQAAPRSSCCLGPYLCAPGPRGSGHCLRGPSRRPWPLSPSPSPVPLSPSSWSSCCALSCAPRLCGPSGAPGRATSARAEPTTRMPGPCSSRSTAGRSQASKLGEQMADLHLYNQKLREKQKEEENTVGCRAEGVVPQYVTKFGFHTVTCCGFIQQVKIPDLFRGLEIVPALLHGDLWSGNVAENDEGPIVYDPACFYGHSEFELAIALMFGGFPRSFFTAYHQKLPKAPGFDRRLLLYQLFNYLNHWNHFGREYRSASLGAMRKLLA
ncbi:PREDICTED: fructosamine-3-kinase isoform X4 [Chinchilla lanigera]|uniref:fructosamine-3-kinase isoform X4 n=1 Tax=Chinchilla lanigera TaxID=34839 RepID=UPI000698BFF4|nr:PREDICTED: fructosamine-3-kinase isoform X4 [Chinchilla lanigera]